MKKIAVIGFGAMGSAIAQRLASSGANVVTLLEGRSEATRKRALETGIREVDLATVVEAELILSIVPPGQALLVAREVAHAMAKSQHRAFFLDCNAVSPATMSEIAGAFGDNIECVYDGCIIGGPPRGDQSGPHIYLSAGGADIVETLSRFGLDARLLDSPIGSASALKMCYAGINKGLIGLGAAMMLAAAECGADKALMVELAESQAELRAKFTKGIPDMYPKAYRWVAEMKEIADFLGPQNPASAIFLGMEGLYQQIAADRAAIGEQAARLSTMLAYAETQIANQTEHASGSERVRS